MSRPELHNGEVVFFRRKCTVHYRSINRVFCPIAPPTNQTVSLDETCRACKNVQEVTDRGVYCRKIMPRYKKELEKTCPV